MIVVVAGPPARIGAGVGLGPAFGWIGVAVAGVGAYAVGDRLLRLPRASTGSLIALGLVARGIPPACLLQAAAPCGINCRVIGHLYGLDMRLAAGAVFWSTAAVLLAACGLALA